MQLFDLNTLLFAGKWVFIALIYFILIVVVIAVRREMVYHTANQARLPVAPGQLSPGRLKVLNSGSDLRLLPGGVLPLRPETRLGAEADNDIILGDQFVSAHHARLRWDGAAWWLEDLGSTNGSTINGRRCPPRIPQAVPDGARLNLGNMVFELQAG